jgi:hypothetical protein
MTEEQIRQLIRQELQALFGNGKIIFDQHIKFTEGKNLETGTGTGSKIGGLDTAKVSVYSATPVIRANHINNPTGGTPDAEARTAINSILTALENFGLLKTS